MAKKWKAKLTPNQFRNKYFKKKIFLPLGIGNEYWSKSCNTCKHLNSDVCDKCLQFSKYERCSYEEFLRRKQKC